MIPSPEMQEVYQTLLAGRDPSHRDSAYTLTTVYDFAPYLTDAVYVGANEKAQEIYGRPLGQEGDEYQSYTLPRAARYRSALYGLKRIEDPGITNSYRTPIIRGNGEIIQVAKITMSINIRGRNYFWTRIESAEDHPEFPHILDLPIPDNSEWERNHVFMADVERAVALGLFESFKDTRDDARIITENEINQLTSDTDQNTIIDMEKASPKLIFEHNMVLLDNDLLVHIGEEPGESFWLSDGTEQGIWFHRCRFCRFRWRSRIPRPRFCANQRDEEGCHRTNWWKGAPETSTPSERGRHARSFVGKKKKPQG